MNDAPCGSLSGGGLARPKKKKKEREQTHVLAPLGICFSPSSLELSHDILKVRILDVVYIERPACIPSRCDLPERVHGAAYGCCYMAHGVV